MTDWLAQAIDRQSQIEDGVMKDVMRLRNVIRTFPGHPPVHALKDVDLEVAPGDFLTVVGPSGSGKSTLLNTLGLLDRPDFGEYAFLGIDVARLKERDRTALRGQQIGFVFQSFQLMVGRTALDNVLMGTLYSGARRRAATKAACEALVAVGLESRIDQVSERLSGGERQRVAIARALVGRPSVLLCDEPTGNLDSESGQRVIELFLRLHGMGTTIVVITHDPDVAAVGSRTVRISDGHLFEGAGRTR